MLLSIEQANARIDSGKPLIIAGSRQALAGLKQGNWIGGSIPYFVDAAGGCCDRDKVFVDEIMLPVSRWKIHTYAPSSLDQIGLDGFASGFSYVIIPANSAAHLEYAMHAPEYPEIFLKPIIGWISGVHLDDLASDTAVVVDGRDGRLLSNQAVVLHAELPADAQPIVRTVNLFSPGDGPSLRFAEIGFSASQVLVDGKTVDLVKFMKDRKWDPKHPLVADYAGTYVNVSIKAIDEAAGVVSSYAPVFPDIDYRESAPVGNYVEAFARVMPVGVEPILSCNCILNYLYGKLDGEATGPFTGPVTFGEIAHQLLNQTLVYLADGRKAG
jgi:hypothetical protein